MSSKAERQALIQWAGNNHQQPCFCEKDVFLDVVNCKATPETIAAIFGIQDPDTITMFDETGAKLGLTIDYFWPLEPEREYEVHTSEKREELLTPISQIFDLFPGKDEDEKSDRIHAMSKNFYAKIWSDPETPNDFRGYFHSTSSSSDIQAFRQYNWLNEVFGGPSLYGGPEKRDEILKPRVMAKHTKSRMTKEHAMTWLKLMKKAIKEEFPDEPKLQKLLGLYWLHFYAFFPFEEEAKKEFRKYIL